MTTKIWNLKEGQITSVLYESGKNRKVLNLRNPVDVDNKNIIDEIDSAMGVLNKYVVSIVDADKKISDKNIDNKESRRKGSNDRNLDLANKINENKHEGADHIHEEANDKMKLLHRENKDRVGEKVRYLIDVNAEKDSVSKKDVNVRRDMILVPKNEVIITRNRKESKAYKDYDIAFQHVIPELVDSVKKDDRGIVVLISDVVQELGRDFEKKSVVSIYTGIRHILFKYGIKVEQCTLKEIDPVTNKGKKGLKLSIFQEGDKPPCSIKKSKKFR